MADVTVSYKGNTIAEMSASGTKTLLTEDKYCEDDFVVNYTKPSGGYAISDLCILEFCASTDDGDDYYYEIALKNTTWEQYLNNDDFNTSEFSVNSDNTINIHGHPLERYDADTDWEWCNCLISSNVEACAYRYYVPLDDDEPTDDDDEPTDDDE